MYVRTIYLHTSPAIYSENPYSIGRLTFRDLARDGGRHLALFLKNRQNGGPM